MPLGAPPRGVPSSAAFIPRRLAHPTSCSGAAPVVEAFRLAPAAAEAAMCVPPRKGACNAQHLEAAATARVCRAQSHWEGVIPVPWRGDSSLCPLSPAPSSSSCGQGPQEGSTHFPLGALVQLYPPEGALRLLTAPPTPLKPRQAVRSVNCFRETQATMAMSEEQALGGSVSAPGPYPRNQARGLQQKHRHQENPFHTPPESQHPQMKG